MTIKFSIDDVAWQQISKHLKKSINAVNDRIYHSQFSVLVGEEEEKGTF